MPAHDVAATYNELTFVRTFDASRDLVYRAWTDPTLLAKWWGPAQWTNPVCEIDVRPGGAILIHMTAEGFPVHPMKGEFLEVVPPERLVFISKIAESAPGVFGAEILTTVNFTEENGKTIMHLTERVIKATPEVAPMLAGQKAGMNQSLDRLLALLTGTEEFVITRLFDAPRELVWRVHTEPEHMAHWWGPKGFTMLSLRMDFRPGGMFHYGMQSPDGHTMWGKLVYREIDAPERLSFVVSFSDEHGGTTRHPMSDTWPREVLLNLTFFEINGKTAIITSGFPINASPEENAMYHGNHASMQEGTKGMYDQFEEYLAQVKK